MYQYWVMAETIDYNKCIILMEDVCNKGNEVWGKWEFSVPSLQFFCKPKTIIKEKCNLFFKSKFNSRRF